MHIEVSRNDLHKLAESAHNIITESNLHFFPGGDDISYPNKSLTDGGLYISSTDGANTTFYECAIEASYFPKFEMDEYRVAGINWSRIADIIDAVPKGNDMVTISADEDNFHTLDISIPGSDWTYTHRVIDPDTMDEGKKPDMDFSISLTVEYGDMVTTFDGGWIANNMIRFSIDDGRVVVSSKGDTDSFTGVLGEVDKDAESINTVMKKDVFEGCYKNMPFTDIDDDVVLHWVHEHKGETGSFPVKVEQHVDGLHVEAVVSPVHV